MWEMMTAHLLPNNENIKKGEDDSFALVGRFTNDHVSNCIFESIIV